MSAHAPLAATAIDTPGGATVHDVARLAGVSAMTVSRVINGRASVSAATRGKVEAAIAALRYQPNLAAQRRAHRHPAHRPVVQQPQRRLSQRISGRRHGAVQPAAAASCCWNAAATGQPACRHQQTGGGRRRRRPGAAAAVRLARSAGAIEPHRHAVDRGGHRPALAGHFRRAHRRLPGRAGDDAPPAGAGPPRYRLYPGRPGPHARPCCASRRFSMRCAKRAWTCRRSGWRRDCLPTARDSTPRSSCCQAPRAPAPSLPATTTWRPPPWPWRTAWGLQVPRQLAVCGFDDTPVATTVWPELTTIHQPIAAMARAAVTLVLDEIRQRRAGTRRPPRIGCWSLR